MFTKLDVSTTKYSKCKYVDKNSQDDLISEEVLFIVECDKDTLHTIRSTSPVEFKVSVSCVDRQ